MPKGPSLTKEERDEIVSLRQSGMASREIAKKLERSKTVVTNYLKDPTKYGTVKRSGRKRSLTKDQEQQIFSALFQSAAATTNATASSTECGDDELVGASSTAAHTAASVAKMSAQRIKQEFNLPLSVRRIQQLLSDWRNDRRKTLDQQHALTTAVTAIPAEHGEELSPDNENRPVALVTSPEQIDTALLADGSPVATDEEATSSSSVDPTAFATV